MCFLWKGSDYHGQKSKTSIKEKRKGWCKEASEAYIRIALYTETPAYVGCTWQVFFLLALGFACGDTVLTAAVLAIVLTAPLGAFAIDFSYRKLLLHED